MSRLTCGLLFLGLLLTAGCNPTNQHAPAIGEAFVGPAAMPLRQEIGQRSATVAMVHHGDRLQIVQQRRRFLKVRTTNGVEGWTDERLLLGPAEMRGLEELSTGAKDYPSQGKATTYETVNIHTEPDRFSPSYLQIKEGEKVDVIEHRIGKRTPPIRKPMLLTPKPVKPVRKTERKQTRIAPPAMPAAPGPPEDWLQLSQTSAPPRDAKAKKEAAPPPDIGDDWTMVRTASGRSGWVLTRRLFMAIPDEVAQYAEGRRITSYFSLGNVHDGDKVKDIWLWTTTEKSHAPYDFDSFRVFIWSLRHHRYETAYIQRRLVGFYPVRVEKENGLPGFSVCLANADGERYRHRYALVENLVKSAGQEPCEPPPPERKEEQNKRLLASNEPAGARQSSDTMAGRMKLKLDALRKQWFGK